MAKRKKRAEFKVELSLNDSVKFLKELAKWSDEESEEDLEEIVLEIYYRDIISQEDLERLNTKDNPMIEPTGSDVLLAIAELLE